MYLNKCSMDALRADYSTVGTRKRPSMWSMEDMPGDVYYLKDVIFVVFVVLEKDNGGSWGRRKNQED